MSTAIVEEPVSAPQSRKLTPLDVACELLATSWTRWHLSLADVGWSGYQRVLQARHDAGRKAVRITYSFGEVEIVTVGNVHEQWKSVLSLLLKMYLVEADVRFVCCGSMTISREDLDRGFEPDECFYLTSHHRVLGHRQLDFATDPPPDLAIEIESTRSMIEKLPVYSAFRVPEIWRFDGTDLTVLVLGADETYQPSKSSLVVPGVPLAELVRCSLLSSQVDDATVARQFREFVRALPSAG